MKAQINELCNGPQPLYLQFAGVGVGDDVLPRHRSSPLTAPTITNIVMSQIVPDGESGKSWTNIPLIDSPCFIFYLYDTKKSYIFNDFVDNEQSRYILSHSASSIPSPDGWPVLAGGGEVGVGRGDNLEAIRVICMIEWGDWCRSHYQHPHYILIDIYISCYV